MKSVDIVQSLNITSLLSLPAAIDAASTACSATVVVPFKIIKHHVSNKDLTSASWS